MSLESLLQENTVALREFTALMSRILRDDIGVTAQAYREAKAVHAEPLDSQTDAVTPEKAAPAPAPSDPVEVSAVPVSEVNGIILNLAKTKGRDVAVALLRAFGATKVPELSPDQYAQVIVKAKEALV